jgi:hypothetical protein
MSDAGPPSSLIPTPNRFFLSYIRCKINNEKICSLVLLFSSVLHWLYSTQKKIRWWNKVQMMLTERFQYSSLRHELFVLSLRAASVIAFSRDLESALTFSLHAHLCAEFTPRHDIVLDAHRHLTPWMPPHTATCL